MYEEKEIKNPLHFLKKNCKAHQVMGTGRCDPSQIRVVEPPPPNLMRPVTLHRKQRRTGHAQGMAGQGTAGQGGAGRGGAGQGGAMRGGAGYLNWPKIVPCKLFPGRGRGPARREVPATGVATGP